MLELANGIVMGEGRDKIVEERGGDKSRIEVDEKEETYFLPKMAKL